VRKLLYEVVESKSLQVKGLHLLKMEKSFPSVSKKGRFSALSSVRDQLLKRIIEIPKSLL